MDIKFVINLIFLLITNVKSHGLMQDPMQRAHGDNCNGLLEKPCGGIEYRGAMPVVRTYRTGQVITIYSNLTANHRGTIVMSLCANPSNPSQACFDQNRLVVVSNSRDNAYTARIPGYTEATFLYNHFYHNVKLPNGFSCEHCVLQWYWWALNTGELYYNCADISILDNAPLVPTYTNWREIPTTTITTTTTTTSTTTRTTTSIRTTTPRTSTPRTSTTTTRTTAMRTTTSRSTRPGPTTTGKTTSVVCSKSKPPLRTDKTDTFKYIGSKVLCFWVNSEIELLCDLCKDNCIDPDNECPSDFCDCRWYL